MRVLLLSVSVAATLAAADQVTFLRDVAPILNKTGCTAGPCHGAAKGKNGFKLSLRGYDPQFDYEALLYDLSGRRFNRADPGRSLMLAKPTQEVAHGGGLRFEIGSNYYKIIYDWIAQGVPFGDPATDTVRRLEVEPKEILMKGPGESASVKVTAIYGDGGSRDLTALAVVHSNIPHAPRLARSHRAIAHPGGSARVRRGRVQNQTEHPERQADRELCVRRSLDPEVGRPAAKQPQISGRKRRVRIPGMDPRFHRAEQTLRPHGPLNARGAGQFL